MDTDVIVVGGGPVGLMLAGELRLAGVRPLVLERHPEVGHSPNANGLGGQIVELLRYRGLLHRFAAVASNPDPEIPGYPFGGMHLDLSRLDDPPLKGLRLQHPSVDRLLAERALEIGAQIRHGHRVVGVEQDDASVTAQVEGPDGPHAVTARFLVGCDGAYSRIRGMAGIGFPGVTYPDVNRLAEVAVHPSVTVLEGGDVEVPGFGRVEAGFTRTEHGVFAMGSTHPGALMVQTIEDEDRPADDETPMTMEELGASIRRVRGVDLPLGEPRRLSRYRHEARQADRYRAGRVLVAGDAAHVLPATGIARSVGMLDAVNLAWKLAAEVRGDAPDGLLDSYDRERRHAGERAMLQSQAQVALRRGLDGAADALRDLFRELLQDEAPSRRLAAMVSGSDVRYPATGPDGHDDAGADADRAPRLNVDRGPRATGDPDPGADDAGHDLVGRFVPDLVLRGNPEVTSVAELLRTARPVLLVLVERPELQEAVAAWRDRVDVHVATTDERPADAVLIRPDAHVAWAAAIGEPADTAASGLREALERWFGAA